MGELAQSQMGEALHRLVSSVLMERVAAPANRLLAPNEMGVATQGECEEIVHGARRLSEIEGHDSSFSMLQMDLKNAFNLINREAFLKQVRLHFPQLYA